MQLERDAVQLPVNANVLQQNLLVDVRAQQYGVTTHANVFAQPTSKCPSVDVELEKLGIQVIASVNVNLLHLKEVVHQIKDGVLQHAYVNASILDLQHVVPELGVKTLAVVNAHLLVENVHHHKLTIKPHANVNVL